MTDEIHGNGAEQPADSAAEIKSTDIVFDCPYCEKSLAIDYRGAGLIISCPDCSNKVQVPIPTGLELSDIDSSDAENETRIIHLRQLISDAQRRVLELEEELEEVKKRRDDLEKMRAESVIRFESVGREIADIQNSMRRISEVVETATGNRKRSPVGEKSLAGYGIGKRP